ncbi:MAG: TonB-dependent receptor [Gammaproteobacteria bacterium]|nr:TonB-dependent receptor [Gammaproteobacteria bacterium]
MEGLKQNTIALAVATAIVAPGALPQAQVVDQRTVDDQLEEVIVTGTRREGVSPTEALSPVDVIGGSNLGNQAAFDLTEGLTKIAPSFNTQRFPIADGTAFIRPVSLRNLSPDHTLVLVNGSRRHRSALVNLQLPPIGTINQGAQAVDFAALPSAAIERVEVLRDGASAQYGSDAIAGVVNVVLKDAAEGFSLSAQTGEYFDEDGERTTLAANAGFALSDRGFVNTTVEYSTSDKTWRGVAAEDAGQIAQAIGEENVPLRGLGLRWGDPEVEALKLFVNTGFNITENTEVYGNIGYTHTETISDFFFRNPVLDPEFGVKARGTLQVDSGTIKKASYMPKHATQAQVDALLAQGLTVDDYLVADASSDSGYILRNPIYDRFPGGYNPNFGADITDLSAAFGMRGEWANGTSWDLSARIAESEVDYILDNTINPSLGIHSPTSFKPGVLGQVEHGLNADFVKPIEISGLNSPLNLAFGLEWREEIYEIGAGDLKSREEGPTARIFGVGSDSFQGFPLAAEGEFSSESWAAYVDLEAEVTERLTLGGALRFEDYEEFGNTSDWKLSARFDVTENFALRATANTGFRVPTPGQVNTLMATTSLDGNGDLIPTSTYPVGHPVAAVFGAKALTPEESQSFTVGAVFSLFDNTSLTLDYYKIDIEDRLAFRNIKLGDEELEQLNAAGIDEAGLPKGSNVNFFTNAYDSEVSGIDLAVTSNFELAGNLLTVDLRHNHNNQEVADVAPNTIDENAVFDLEHYVPKDRTTLTLDYDIGGQFGGYLRLNRYGDWGSTCGQFCKEDEATPIARYGSEWLIDLEARLIIKENYTLAFGGENIFDVRPEDEQSSTLQGMGVKYALTSPFGFNGAFWYLRASMQF